MNSAVERAIASIWERYNEPLSLAEIAKSAILSRFHFSRVFREATGVSPGRFLTAVRIYQAKRMLVTTSLSVTDISLDVGYNSLGSFTNRFTESVGISPARFRRMSKNGTYELPDLAPGSTPFLGMVDGCVGLPRAYAGARVYLGAFKNPIVQGLPAAATIVRATSPGQLVPYRLAGVPAGEWFVQAVAVADTADPEPWTRRSLLVATQGCVSVRPDCVAQADVYLRPRRPTDLPILLALPDLESEPILLTLPDRKAEPIRAVVRGMQAERGLREALPSRQGIELLEG
jgi:AraC family transcriptional regulator